MGCTELYLSANRKPKVEPSSMSQIQHKRLIVKVVGSRFEEHIKYRQKAGKKFKESEYAESWNIKFKIKTSSLVFFKDNIPSLEAYTVIHSKKILYSLFDRRKEQRGVHFSFPIL